MVYEHSELFGVMQSTQFVEFVYDESGGAVLTEAEIYLCKDDITS
jgi:hypothetical protein